MAGSSLTILQQYYKDALANEGFKSLYCVDHPKTLSVAPDDCGFWYGYGKLTGKRGALCRECLDAHQEKYGKGER